MCFNNCSYLSIDQLLSGRLAYRQFKVFYKYAVFLMTVMLSIDIMYDLCMRMNFEDGKLFSIAFIVFLITSGLLELLRGNIITNPSIQTISLNKILS